MRHCILLLHMPLLKEMEKMLISFNITCVETAFKKQLQFLEVHFKKPPGFVFIDKREHFLDFATI